MLPVKRLVPYALFSLIGACAGPKVPTCVVLEDLRTEFCVPYDKSAPEYTRPLEAGTVTYSPEDWAKLMKWINDHRK